MGGCSFTPAGQQGPRGWWGAGQVEGREVAGLQEFGPCGCSVSCWPLSSGLGSPEMLGAVAALDCPGLALSDLSTAPLWVGAELGSSLVRPQFPFSLRPEGTESHYCGRRRTRGAWGGKPAEQVVAAYVSTGICMSMWGWGWCGYIGWTQMQPSHSGREPVHVHMV